MRESRLESRHYRLWFEIDKGLEIVLKLKANGGIGFRPIPDSVRIDGKEVRIDGKED